MPSEKSTTSEVIRTASSKLPKLTRKQTVWLAAGGMICGTTLYVAAQWLAPHAAPPQQFGNITTHGRSSPIIPVVASGDATVTFSLELEEAKSLLPDPENFTHFETDLTERLVRWFNDATSQLASILERNVDSPRDTDARDLCHQSRVAFYAFSILVQRDPSYLDSLSPRLLELYSRADSLLAQCGCSLCKHMAQSINTRKQYLSSVARHGSTFASPQHLRRLADDP